MTDVAEDTPPAPEGLSVSLADDAFSITWSAVTGAATYEVQYRISGSDDDWASVETTTATAIAFSPDGGPACGTTYEFRVRAYGDGTTYAAVWGAESDAEPATTDACNRDPELGTDAYSFSIAENAATTTAVGSVSATDPDEGDTVSYSITTENEDGVFEIDGSTGEIAVAGEMSHYETPIHTLTVQASDGNGGIATATVEITVTSVCLNGVVVPDPDDNPGLVGDCIIVYGVREALAGSVSLDWNGSAAIADWQGVRVRGVPGRVGMLLLADLGLDGTIPPALGGLSSLTRLDLDGNDLTGGIPSELGDLSSLRVLYLEGNQLTGSIPEALGKLDNLYQFVLDGNQLSGSVPAALGDTESLTELLLRDNLAEREDTAQAGPSGAGASLPIGKFLPRLLPPQLPGRAQQRP